MNIFQDNQNDYQMQFMRNETKIKNPRLFDPQEAFMLGNLLKIYI